MYDPLRAFLSPLLFPDPPFYCAKEGWGRQTASRHGTHPGLLLTLGHRPEVADPVDAANGDGYGTYTRTTISSETHWGGGQGKLRRRLLDQETFQGETYFKGLNGFEKNTSNSSTIKYMMGLEKGF